MSKTCCVCEEIKPLTKFSKNGRGPCRSCLNARANAKVATVAKVEPGYHKTCVMCKVELPISAFGQNKRKPDGKNAHCDTCRLKMRQKQVKKVATHLATNPTLPDKKCCLRCNKTKLLTEFAIWNMRKDGRSNECKVCTVERARQRTAERLEARAKHPSALPEDKICVQCKLTKHISLFGEDRKMDNGLNIWCKECVRQCSAEYHQKKADIVHEAKLQQGNSCADCQLMFEPFELEFAHFNRYVKARDKDGRTVTLSNLTPDLMKRELKNGRFLCKRCHLKETFFEDQERVVKNPTQRRAYERKVGPLQEFIRQDKLARGKCAMCEEHVLDTPWDLRYFEYDHVDPRLKSFLISEGVLKGFSEHELRNELQKCQLLCSPCHKLKTRAQNDLARGKERPKADPKPKIKPSLQQHPVDENESRKCCANCKELTPLSQFSKNISSPDGREHRCKKCMAKIETEYISRKRSQMALTVKICLMCKEEKPMNDYAPLAHDIRLTSSYCNPCYAKLKATTEKNKQEKSDAAIRTTLECSKCKQELTKDKFDINLRSNKGHAAKCRDCVAFYELRKKESDEICRRRVANEPLDNLTKTCAGCKEAKPLTSFCADKSRDGFLIYCRECHHENYKRTRENLKSKQNAKRQKVSASTTISTTTSVTSYKPN